MPSKGDELVHFGLIRYLLWWPIDYLRLISLMLAFWLTFMRHLFEEKEVKFWFRREVVQAWWSERERFRKEVELVMNQLTW